MGRGTGGQVLTYYSNMRKVLLKEWGKSILSEMSEMLQRGGILKKLVVTWCLEETIGLYPNRNEPSWSLLECVTLTHLVSLVERIA